MKLNVTMKAVVLALSVAGLAACSSTSKTTSDAMGGPTAMGGAQAYGAGSSSLVSADGVDLRALKGPYASTAVAGQNESFYFDFDKSVVQQAYLADLQIHANYLIANPSKKVKLEGNTDARGSREYNVALGWRRADAVAQVLQMDGVSKSQIEEVSYGAERPFATGTNAQDYQLNRRVDLIYSNGNS